ncbi:MAG: type II toxin-antitoxin system VapC family toxin [Acidobacteria bacterium]|nr:type II toxin-antitoxin system VapC family toxin [Acidobacteriota bacterium]MYJ03639.1 type II toxin-antitoxin system VapC family toxin [Acidobacteriota bacterium]
MKSVAVVLDASVVVELVLGTRSGEGIRRALPAPQVSLHTLDLVDLEVLNALRRYVGSGTVEAGRAALAVDHLNEFDLLRRSHRAMLHRIWSWRHNLTPYDAAYVTLAEALSVPLLTMDRRLAQAPGLPIDVDVFTPPS